MPAAEILHTSANCQLACHQNLFIMAWSDTPAISEIREMERTAILHNKRHPEGVAALDLIVAGRPQFTDELRKEVVRINKSPDLFRLGYCDAILIGGLTGSAVRAFLSTVSLLARPAKPSKIVGDLKDAAAWLAPLLSVGQRRWTPADVIAVTDPIVKARAPK